MWLLNSSQRDEDEDYDPISDEELAMLEEDAGNFTACKIKQVWWMWIVSELIIVNYDRVNCEWS